MWLRTISTKKPKGTKSYWQISPVSASRDLWPLFVTGSRWAEDWTCHRHRNSAWLKRIQRNFSQPHGHSKWWAWVRVLAEELDLFTLLLILLYGTLPEFAAVWVQQNLVSWLERRHVTSGFSNSSIFYWSKGPLVYIGHIAFNNFWNRR